MQPVNYFYQSKIYNKLVKYRASITKIVKKLIPTSTDPPVSKWTTLWRGRVLTVDVISITFATPGIGDLRFCLCSRVVIKIFIYGSAIDSKGACQVPGYLTVHVEEVQAYQSLVRFLFPPSEPYEPTVPRLLYLTGHIWRNIQLWLRRCNWIWWNIDRFCFTQWNSTLKLRNCIVELLLEKTKRTTAS